MKLSIPDDSIFEEYNNNVRTIVDLILNLKSQNSQLRQARDILLPRLMNGEINVEKEIPASMIIEMTMNKIIAAEDETSFSNSSHLKSLLHTLKT
jgi:hypothetical protein